MVSNIELTSGASSVPFTSFLSSAMSPRLNLAQIEPKHMFYVLSRCTQSRKVRFIIRYRLRNPIGHTSAGWLRCGKIQPESNGAVEWNMFLQAGTYMKLFLTEVILGSSGLKETRSRRVRVSGRWG
jgi:hypothetical protein